MDERTIKANLRTPCPTAGALRELYNSPAMMRAKRIALFRGAKSFAASGAEAAFWAHKSTLTEVAEFVVDTSNPKWECVQRAVRWLRSLKPDAVIAVGGGTVLDTAKCALAGVQRPQATLEQLCGSLEAPCSAPPYFVLVPTTPGTGSECTPFATVYHDEIKHSVDCTAVMPGEVLLDPLLLQSLSRYQVVCCVLDAVCQSIEALWAKGNNAQSSYWAWQALDTLQPILMQLRLNSAQTLQNLEVASRTMLGGHLSGLAIAKSRTTAPHALSYGLTILHAVPHGHAVAVMMLAVLRYHHANRLSEYTANVESKVALRLFGATRLSLDALWQRLLQDLGVAATLSDLGVSAAEAGKLISLVNAQRMNNHPELIEITALQPFLVM